MTALYAYLVFGVFVAFYRATATLGGERTQRMAVDVYTDLEVHDWPSGVAFAATLCMVAGLVAASVAVWPYFPARTFWRKHSQPGKYRRIIG